MSDAIKDDQDLRILEQFEPLLFTLPSAATPSCFNRKPRAPVKHVRKTGDKV